MFVRMSGKYLGFCFSLFTLGQVIDGTRRNVYKCSRNGRTLSLVWEVRESLWEQVEEASDCVECLELREPSVNTAR